MLACPSRDHGFTLIELTISIAILGIVISGIVAAILVALLAGTETDIRLTESRDEQLASTYFSGDVQRAKTIAISGSPRCGTDPAAALVVEFVGHDFDSSLTATTTVVTYVKRTVAQPDGTTALALHRLACTAPGDSPSFPLTAVQDTRLARRLASITVHMPAADSVIVNLAEKSGSPTYTLTGVTRVT